MANDLAQTTFSEINQSGGIAGSSELMNILGSSDIQPGSEPSYQLCKAIYLYHPLGAKMAEAPISMAQSQERAITIQDAPEEVRQAFCEKWQEIDAEGHILNLHAQARVYGEASLILGIEKFATEKPANLETLFEQDIFFNVLDPLNTAGSLVLSQMPGTADFQKPRGVRVSGRWYHASRCQVVFNEKPIFISYTSSAFGFVGRSVYQRALFPLKSFIKSMVADDQIMGKLALIIAKLKAPGSIINQGMMKIAAWKRTILKWAISGQVASIDHDEDVSTINMQNVDGAGTYARTNILKNVATAADMPAKLLENETMVAGFGEGTEDAKNIARYVDRTRIKMRPAYKWFDNITQYLAWNPIWYKTVIQTKYEDYKSVDWQTAFLTWRKSFAAEWPSVLIEPESEEIKKEEVKLEAVVAILNTLLQVFDPTNKANLIQWAADCFGENKRLFPHELDIDWDTLADFLEQNQEQQQESHDASIDGGKKFPSFGDTAIPDQLGKLRALVNDLGRKPRLLEAVK